MILDIRDEKEQGIYNEIFMDKVYGDVQPDEIVVDIGANVGYFTLFALQASAIIYAYEPELGNYKRMMKQVYDNDFIFGRGNGYRCAVAGNNKGRTLSIHPSNIGGHSTTYPVGDRKEEVPSVTLDEIAEKLERIDLLKMDCEGAEFEILAAASERTMGKIGRIMMEVHTSVAPVSELKKILDKHFRSVQIWPNKWDASLPYIKAFR